MPNADESGIRNHELGEEKPLPKIKIVFGEGFAVTEESHGVGHEYLLVVQKSSGETTTSLMHKYYFDSYDKNSLTLKPEYNQISPGKYLISFPIYESCKDRRLANVSLSNKSIHRIEIVP